MGAIFVAEAISVILQVGFFKMTKLKFGKGVRLLRMAPLHHHFEIGGIKEQKIVINFWMATICCIIIGLLIHTTN